MSLRPRPEGAARRTPIPRRRRKCADRFDLPREWRWDLGGSSGIFFVSRGVAIPTPASDYHALPAGNSKIVSASTSPLGEEAHAHRTEGSAPVQLGLTVASAVTSACPSVRPWYLTQPLGVAHALALGRRPLAHRQGRVREGVEAPAAVAARRPMVELSDLARRRSLLVAALVALRVKQSEPERWPFTDGSITGRASVLSRRGWTSGLPAAPDECRVRNLAGDIFASPHVTSAEGFGAAAFCALFLRVLRVEPPRDDAIRAHLT